MKPIGKVKSSELDFEKGNGLIPVIVQEYKTRKILMLAYMNKEALNKTLETGLAHYYSRSRKKLWKKGETSGHIQKVKRILVDCDNDTLLLQVEQIGNACHKGEHSCFHMLLSEAEEIHKRFDEEILAKIKREVENAKVIRKSWVKDESKKDYLYILNAITEHYNPPEPEVYEWIAEKLDELTSDNVDKIVVPECFGIPIAQLLASRKGKPLAIIRKRPLVPGDKGVEYSSGYEKGNYYIYGLKEGDSIILVDDAVSTGGTLLSIIKELENMDVNISDVVCIVSKESYEGSKIIFKETKLKVKSIVRVFLDDTKPRVEASYNEDVSFSVLP
jgi:phosphoribosyl-AMP cyclohydrolase/adenine/guanine phosphoribosyltransferase-like PRPP-binding protein